MPTLKTAQPETMTAEEYRLLRDNAKIRRHKYNASPTTVDGIRFDSKAEARRYEELKQLQEAGIVAWFTTQVPFRLAGGIVYRCDFLVVLNDDPFTPASIVVEDVKGVKTAAYRMKRKLFREKYEFDIREI